MPTFDPAQYVDMETTQESKKRPPLDPADYTAIIGEVAVEPWSKGDKSGLRMKVPLKIQLDPGVRERLGLTTDTLTLTDSVFLDTNEQGMLDYGPGRNSGLRRYREATGQNVAGQPFSPRRLIGQAVLVKIKHDMYQGEVQEQIAGVAKVQ